MRVLQAVLGGLGRCQEKILVIVVVNHLRSAVVVAGSSILINCGERLLLTHVLLGMRVILRDCLLRLRQLVFL